MKAKIVQPVIEFTPVTIQITIESKEEAIALWEIANVNEDKLADFLNENGDSCDKHLPATLESFNAFFDLLYPYTRTRD